MIPLRLTIRVWLAWWSHKAAQERKAVAALRKAGAKVLYDFHEAWMSEQDQIRYPERPPYWPAWLVDTLGVDYFAHVAGVSFNGTHVTYAGLEHLKCLTGLHSLGLNDTKVTDAGLEHLKGLSHLHW